LRRAGDTGITVIFELLAFTSSGETLKASPSPHHCRPSSPNSDQKKRHFYKMTAMSLPRSRG
jgi:hypothetical protein